MSVTNPFEGMFATTEPVVEEVPKGTVHELLEWVGDDEDKALRVLEAEDATGEPRSSLVDKLNKKFSSK